VTAPDDGTDFHADHDPFVSPELIRVRYSNSSVAVSWEVTDQDTVGLSAVVTRSYRSGGASLVLMLDGAAVSDTLGGPVYTRFVVAHSPATPLGEIARVRTS
jgi:hypothetical protein